MRLLHPRSNAQQINVVLVVVQLLSHVRLFVSPRTAAHQASLSFTISRSLLKFRSIESLMPSNYLILCCPLLLLPSIFPSIRVFSNESALCIRWHMQAQMLSVVSLTSLLPHQFSYGGGSPPESLENIFTLREYAQKHLPSTRSVQRPCLREE